MWDFCLESLNAESASESPMAERDGLAAQAVAEAATYKEPLPDSDHELKVRSVGPVFPFLSATGCEHTRQKGIISKCNDLQAYCPGQHVRLGCGQVAFFA